MSFVCSAGRADSSTNTRPRKCRLYRPRTQSVPCMSFLRTGPPGPQYRKQLEQTWLEWASKCSFPVPGHHSFGSPRRMTKLRGTSPFPSSRWGCLPTSVSTYAVSGQEPLTSVAEPIEPPIASSLQHLRENIAVLSMRNASIVGSPDVSCSKLFGASREVSAVSWHALARSYPCNDPCPAPGMAKSN